MSYIFAIATKMGVGSVTDIEKAVADERRRLLAVLDRIADRHDAEFYADPRQYQNAQLSSVSLGGTIRHMKYELCEDAPPADTRPTLTTFADETDEFKAYMALAHPTGWAVAVHGEPAEMDITDTTFDDRLAKCKRWAKGRADASKLGADHPLIALLLSDEFLYQHHLTVCHTPSRHEADMCFETFQDRDEVYVTLWHNGLLLNYNKRRNVIREESE